MSEYPFNSMAKYEQEEAVITAVKLKPSTQQEICRVIGITDKTAKKVLDRLVEKKKINVINYGNALCYVIGTGL